MRVYQKFTGALSALVIAMSGSLASAQLVNQGGTITIQQGATLVVGQNAQGSIDWPAQGVYGTGLDHIDPSGGGGQIWASVLVPPMTLTCVPGALGPRYENGLVEARMLFERDSKTTETMLNLSINVQNTDPQQVDGRQVIDSSVLTMDFTLAAGDTDWDVLTATAKPGGTGKTVLSPLPSGDFEVDSFFDIILTFSGQGAVGGPFEGVVLDADVPVRLMQTLNVFDGVSFEPLGDAEVRRVGDCLVADNLGSSGCDGVRIGSAGAKRGYDHYAARAQMQPAAGGMLGNGESMSAFPFPPPPLDLPDLPDLPASVEVTNTGGTASGVYTSNGLGATEWVVSVWLDGDLQVTSVVPDAGVAWSMPATDFCPRGLEMLGRSPIAGGRTLAIVIDNDCDGDVSVAGVSGAVTGDRIEVSVRDPQVLPGYISHMDIMSSGPPICIDGVWTREFGVLHQGIGNAVMSRRGGALVIDNLGSSGCDGVSLSVCGDCCDEDCDDYLPLDVQFDPIDVEGWGGKFWTRALDGDGENVATSTYDGSGAGGGCILVNYVTASTVCRVSVWSDGEFVGEADVPISSGVETEVCRVSGGAAGTPRLTGCGKQSIGWPWELSCLVQEFDRDVTFRPTGGAPLVGDEVRLLAPGATEAEVQSIRAIELRASGIPEIKICTETTGPFLPSPVLPPSPITAWDFPGVGTALSQVAEGYYTWDPATGEAVCVNKSIRDMVLVSQNGNRRTYSATMDLHLEGVGGLIYSKDFELPGQLTFEYDNSATSGDDVQQYEVQLRDYQFMLPQGTDPDIRTLRVRSGSDNGFSGGGDVIISKIPECELEIQAILDILADFELEGSQGGPLGGGGPVHIAAHEAAHIVQQSSGSAGGIAFTPVGAASASVVNDVLELSNLGSSGLDGVSLDLPNSDSVTVTFDPASPVEIVPGGVFRITPHGQASGKRVGAPLGRTSLQRSSDPDVFFDIILQGNSSWVPNLDAYDGRLEVVTGSTGQARLHPAGGALNLPGIKCCGGYSEVGTKAAGHFIEFDAPVIFRVAGEPDVEVTSIRSRFEGMQVRSMSSIDIKIDGVDGECRISEIAVGVFGRQIALGSKGELRANHNTTRSNKTQPIWVDLDPDDDNDGSGIGELEMRPPRSVFLPGSEQLWPLVCRLEGGLVADTVGGSLKIEGFGTIDGTPGAAFGEIELCSDGDSYLLKADFTPRGSTHGVVIVRKRLDKASPKLSTSAPTGGSTGITITRANGLVGLPLAYVSAVPELYEPPHGEVECSYRLSFSEPVLFDLPGIGVEEGMQIELRLQNPTHTSEDISTLRISGHGIKPLLIESIGTGPFYGQGLEYETVGGAQIEEETPGDRGPLVVSNLGSSGDDGVRVDLGQGEGIWHRVKEVDKATPLLYMGLALVEEPCLGLPENCDELAVAMRGGESPTFEVENLSGQSALHSVVGTSPDGSGGMWVGGSFAGCTVADVGGGDAQLIGMGVLPPALIEGIGLVGESVAYQFDVPVVVTPVVGQPFTCDLLRFCAAPGQPLVEVARKSELRVSGLDQMEIEDTQLFHLDKVPHASLGGAELIPVDGALIVDNLGSSGLDGVRSRSRVPSSKIHNKMVQVLMAIAAPEPDGGFPTLKSKAHGSLDGVPDQQLGESCVTLGSTDNRIPIGVDFTSLGAQEVRVMVCDTQDEDCDGATEVGIVDITETHTTCECTHLIAGPGGPPAVIGCGKLGERRVPGGIQPPCFFWDFDRPFEFVLPGAEPGTGVVGCRLLLLVHGAGDIDVDIESLDLVGNNLEQITLLQSAGPPDSFFDNWLELHFTPQEIAQLDAVGYDGDVDGDGYSEVEEFLLGLDPISADGTTHLPELTFGPGGPQGAQGLRTPRISFEFDPTKQGGEHELECSVDLTQWVSGEGMFQLISRETLPSGNQRETWERTEPISSNAREQYRHRGHVTILK